VLKEVDIELTAKNLTVNVSITNQSQVPASFASLTKPVYQFIQINGSVANNTAANIDQYITLATYNFSVPNAWIQSQGVSSANIKLFKYDNSSSTWSVLPTSLISSNTSYSSYSATSSSFSAYAVSYTSSVTTGTGTGVSLVTSGAYTTNFFVIGGQDVDTATTQTNTVANIVVDKSSEVQVTSGSGTGARRSINTSVIGHGQISVGAISYAASNGCAHGCNTVIVSVPANVIYTSNTNNGNIYTSAGSYTASTAQTYNVVYNVGTSNSLVVLFYSSGGGVYSGSPTTNAVTGQYTCTLAQNTVLGGKSGAAAMICNDVIAGTGYIASMTLPINSNGVTYAMSAYVFPPYTVTLSDSPTSANILTNGFQQNSGNTMSVIGTSSINAIYPASGSYVFSGWSSSSASNLIISSPGSANTYLTVEGSGTLTATFNTYATITTPVPSNIILDAGQYVIYNTVISNGKGPFTVNLINTATSYVVNTVTGANQGTVTFSPNVPAVGNPDTFNVVAVDTGAGTPYTFNSLSNSIVVYADPTVSITPINTIIDSGQYFTATTSASGGGGSFSTYNFLVFNAITNVIIANQLSAGTTAAILTNALWTTNDPIKANVFVKDTGVTSPFTFNSVNSIAVPVNSPQAVGLLTETNTIIDTGQYSSLSAGATTQGSSPYTYNWFANGACTQPSVATGTTYLVNPTSSTTYSFNSVDSATTANVVCSASNTVTVSGALVAGLLKATNTILDNGQWTQLSASPSGGSGTLTVNWFANGACTQPSVSTGTTYTLQPPTGSDTYTYNVVDSATTKNVVCSASNTMTVRAAPTVSAPIPSNVLLDARQYVVYNTILTGTGSSFTVNLINQGTPNYVVSSLTGQTPATLTFSANVPATGSAVTFVVVANDLGTTTSYGFGSGTNIIVVNTAMNPQISSSPALPATLNTGQTITFNAQTGFGGGGSFNSNGLGTWTGSGNYPIPLTVSSCVTYGTTVYCVGGTNAGQFNVNSVYYAPISSTGVGGWTATTAYPANVAGESCISYGGNIYCIGGDFNVNTNTVYYAPILTSNALGSWTSVTNYPVNAQLPSCLDYGSNIYCVGGVNVNNYNSVYYAPILTSNALGSWTSVTNYPANVQGTRCILYGNNIYCVGGFMSTYTNAVYYAPILTSNALGSWTSVTNYPTNIGWHSCTSYSNTIFCIAGYNSLGSNYVNAIYYAPIFTSNLLGSWTATPNYLMALGQHSCIGYSNSITCIGGITAASVYTNAIYYTSITGTGGGSGTPVGGQPPYAYNFVISNTITNSVVAYNLYSSVYTTTNSYVWTIPSNMGGNTLSANIIITDSASTPVTLNSIDSNTLTVSTIACFASITNTVINFGSISPTKNVATQNAVTDTNTGGTSAAYVYVFGGNWLVTSGQTYGFDVSNTVWATSSGVPWASANPLSAAVIANTLLYLPAGGSNTVWFGLQIPSAEAATSYNENIVVESSC
jgi:PGF-pre-PGF domain-containing protein